MKPFRELGGIQGATEENEALSGSARSLLCRFGPTGSSIMGRRRQANYFLQAYSSPADELIHQPPLTGKRLLDDDDDDEEVCTVNYIVLQ